MSDILRDPRSSDDTSLDADLITATAAVAVDANALLRAYGQYLRRNIAAPGLGVTDQAALSFLYERRRQGIPATSTDVTSYLGVSSPSGVAIIDRLEARGLVHREAHPDDARKKLIVPNQGDADSPLERAVANAVSRIPLEHADAVALFLRTLVDELDVMDAERDSSSPIN